MPRSRQAGAHPGGNSTQTNTQARSSKIEGIGRRVRWRDFFMVFSSVWVTLVCSVVSSESALIGSSSPVSRSLSSSNYILFSPLLVFSLCPLAFLFVFWLGSAADYRSHTPHYYVHLFSILIYSFSNLYLETGKTEHI